MSYVRSMYDFCPGGETRNLFNDHNREKPIANVLGLHMHQIRPFADIHRPRTRSRIFALIVCEKHVYAFFSRQSGFYQTTVMKFFRQKALLKYYKINKIIEAK